MNEAQQQGSYYQSYLAKWPSSASPKKLIALCVSTYVGRRQALALAQTSLLGALRVVGFSSIGPVAHSWASAWQSTVAVSLIGHPAPMPVRIGAALFSWAQHVSMTWSMFTPTAIVGVVAAVLFSSGYIAQSAWSVCPRGAPCERLWWWRERKNLLLSTGSDGEVKNPL